MTITREMTITQSRERVDRNRRTPVWIFVQLVCRILTTVFFDLKFYGAYYVPKTGGALLVSNHQSYIDPVLLALGLDRTLSYMAKSQLFKNPLFAWLIRSLNAFPVEQGAGDIGAVKESIARLQDGYLLNVFPEGSRTEDGEMLPLERGVALLIRRAKVPVVPAVITGSYEAWPKSKKFLRPHAIRVVYGPPMDLANLDRDEMLALIDQTLRRMYEEARAGKFPRGPRRPKGR
jgi:1-acyl-sn-glycerol-3-phosphate acyltransferase